MGARLNIAETLIGIEDWQELSQAIADRGGVRQGDDDRYSFPDGSTCIVPCLTFVAGKHSHRSERTKPRVILGQQETSDASTAINRLSFRFASSMPQIPHEYTCRPGAAIDADYVALFMAIMESPVIAAWQGTKGNIKNQKPLRYLHAGGYWYWSMSSRRTVQPYSEGRHPLWLSHHINRCTDDAFGKTNMVIIRG